jgi:hypothetical protein
MRMSSLRIEDPCHENWDAMHAQGARRFCDQCQKNVHDLSAMTEAEARALLASRSEGRLCVRYTVDASGTIRFRTPAPIVPASALRRRGPAARLVPAAAIAMALAACTPHEQPKATMGEPMPVLVEEKPQPAPPQVEIPSVDPEPQTRELMGDVEVVDEPCDVEPTAPVQHVKMGMAAPLPEPRGG